jgi:Apea-like HEPN
MPSQAIPEEARSPKLKGYLRNWSEAVASIKINHPELLKGVSLLLTHLCSYWLLTAEQHTDPSYQEKRAQIEQAGFEGERVIAELEEILSQDIHLRECCETAFNLASYVDPNFLYVIVTFIELDKLTDETFDNFFNIFSNATYGQPFKKFTLSHLFNFESTENRISFDGIYIILLEAARIPEIIGDVSVYTYLHNHQTGDFFLVTESTGRCPDVVDWLFKERAIALNFMDILQYYKDGVVHIDYTTPYFLPEWVNEIRKRGLAFVGEPRRTPYIDSNKFYRLSQEEAAEVNRWWQIYQNPQVEERLENHQNKLRQALLRAGDFYETSIHQKDAVTRLINLAIALESLFSPPTKTELNYRIGLYVSLLISLDVNERIENFNFIKEMYKRRSDLFHGSYDVNRYQQGNFVTNEEAERLASIIRVSILRFLVLYLKGEDSRDNILGKLNSGVLDANVIEELRLQSDPQTFMEQFQLSTETQ